MTHRSPDAQIRKQERHVRVGEVAHGRDRLPQHCSGHHVGEALARPGRDLQLALVARHIFAVDRRVLGNAAGLWVWLSSHRACSFSMLDDRAGWCTNRLSARLHTMLLESRPSGPRRDRVLVRL